MTFFMKQAGGIPAVKALVAPIKRWLVGRGRPAKPERLDIRTLSRHLQRDIGYNEVRRPESDPWSKIFP